MLIDVFTQEQLETDVLPLSPKDKAQLRKGWRFDWLRENKERRVHKLVGKRTSDVIYGLISFEERSGYVFLNLIERAGFAQSKKQYEGVLQTLVAFACQKSMELGYEGAVAFDSKTTLIEYYEKTLGAVRLGNSSRMVVETDVAIQLINDWL